MVFKFVYKVWRSRYRIEYFRIGVYWGGEMGIRDGGGKVYKFK